MACYLTAVVHDFEHRGVNNVFLVKSHDPLAIIYNDNSPMENHHVAAAWRVMSHADFDFLTQQSADSRTKLRAQMIGGCMIGGAGCGVCEFRVPGSSTMQCCVHQQ